MKEYKAFYENGQLGCIMYYTYIPSLGRITRTTKSEKIYDEHVKLKSSNY